MRLYPAIFAPEETGYSVSFPDLPGCLTEGGTDEEAYSRAVEALGLYLTALAEDGQPIPAPSGPSEFSLPVGAYLAVVAVDENKYRRRNKAVKKTLTIPEWLNEEAEARNINFSGILQAALKAELSR
jgi:predicted RNase H-like HicB family nuclease